jgi:thermitase
MLHTLMRWLLTSILLAGTLVFTPLANAAPGEKRWVPGQILVAPRVGVGPADFDAALQRHGGRSKGRVGALDVHIVSVPAHAEEAVAKALAHNPGIRFAELDVLVKPDITSANDTYYPDGWHLATINAPAAWDSSLGSGVIVAVLDSGVDASHPDLQGQLVPGWNMYDNNVNTADVYGHGTKVAGVIAALSNNGMGVTSIAWNAKIMPVRISGTDGWASSSTIANGLSWAANNGAQIANISYAVTGSSTVTSAASYMRSKGGVVFVSAGNDGNQSSIAPNASIITVSATQSGDTLAGWSTYGDFVDIAAPGAGIWSTKNGGDYAAVSDTSFSSPAAAVGALVMASNSSLTPDEVEDILKGSSVDLGSPGKDEFFGYGRVDAAAAVATAGSGGSTGGGEPDPVDTVAPLVSIASPTGGVVSGVVTVAVNASDDTGVDRVELFANGVRVKTDFTAPYNMTWDTSSNTGSVNLVAKAFDIANNQGVSSTVSVTVDNVVVADITPPTVAILSPSSSGITVSGTVQINMTAEDNVGIALLKCYVDGALKGTTTAGTLSCSWNTRKAATGLHTIRAYAEDTAGLTAISEVQVEVVSTSKGGGGKTGGGGKGRKK